MSKFVSILAAATMAAIASISVDVSPVTAKDSFDDGIVCDRDEKRGCLTFQIAGAKYGASIARVVDLARQDRRVEVTTLGMDVLEGMVNGSFRQAGKRSYCLILWMRPPFLERNFPIHRMGEFRVADARTPGRVTSHPVSSDHGCRGRLPVIDDPRVPSLGEADFSFTGTQSGAGLGWGIPYDVAKHIAYAMICPDGETHYPNRITANMGIVITREEIIWAIGNGMEGIVSAVVWQ